MKNYTAVAFGALLAVTAFRVGAAGKAADAPPKLSEAQVVKAAERFLSTESVDFKGFRARKPSFDIDDRTWMVLFESDSDRSGFGQDHFGVVVPDDNPRKAQLQEGL